jgi:uncharacterized protein YjdB
MKIKFYSKFILASLLCCIAVVFTSCDDIFASEDNPIASYLSMSDKDVTIKIGDTYKRTAIAVSGAVIEYSSSDETVATVDNEGTVTGISVGDATITATATGYNTSGKKIYLAESKTYNVKVNPILAQSVTITNPISTALFNETSTLTATVSPANTTDKSITWSSDNTAVVTVDENTGIFTALKSVGSAKITATAVGGAKASFTVVVGLLPGVFTVDNGTPAKKVQFAQGNLQYQASTNTWRIAENQYDYVGNNTFGNVYVGSTKCNNTYISNTYTGWIDLFGWGTAGHSFTTGYGTAYQPWSISTTNVDYGPTDGTTGLTGIYSQGDWGTNIGENWYTLSQAEWVWLIGPKGSANPGTNCRTSSTINGVDNARYVKGIINTDNGTGGIKGLILFPDVISIDDPVNAATNWGSINGGGGWNAQFTSEQWTKLAKKGCVFLPAAGYRGGITITMLGGPYNDRMYSRYWSSTPDNTEGAKMVNFMDTDENPESYFSRSNGCSVRLVYPAQ